MNWETVKLKGKKASGEVISLGAMVGPVHFELAGGRLVNPLQVAPWVTDSGPDFDAMTGLLPGLRGEWPCVPFGMPRPPTDLPEAWLDGLQPGPALDAQQHGYSANNHWTLTGNDDGSVSASITYPETHPIERLERRVSIREADNALLLELTVHPRADCFLPVSLHPTFRMPAEPGTVKLSFGGEPRVWTYPITVEPERTTLALNQQDLPLDKVVSQSGTAEDITTLPFAKPSEDLVLLTGTNGKVHLDNLAERYRATLEWEADKLPNVMLWMSNGGRQDYPWNGRHHALGIEPLAGVFDFGPAMGATKGPMQQKGVAVGVNFTAGTAWTLTCTITCEAL